MQPDIHFCAAFQLTGIAEFHRQILALLQRGIHAEHLHQIDDRRAPVKIATVTGIYFFQMRDDIDVLHRRRLRRYCSGGWLERNGGGCGWRGGDRLFAKNCVLDTAKNTHDFLLRYMRPEGERPGVPSIIRADRFGEH